MNFSKLNWEVRAGDNIGESDDDQKCGDHYIEKGLECHDGDAHRPTPGKNPYWQGGRKGSGDKSKSGQKSSDRGQPHKRDKSERTERSSKEGSHGDHQEQAKFAVNRFDHYADMMEKNNPDMEWTDDRKHELLEMVMRDTAREFSLDSDELGFTDKDAINYGPIDNYLSSRDRGRKGRALWRPRSDERHGPGTNVSVPPEHKDKEGLIHDVKKQTRDSKKSESSSKYPNLGILKSLKWVTSSDSEPDKETEAEEKEDNAAFPGAAPLFTKASTLHWVTAEPRPCYPSEDPVEDHCNPNISPDSNNNDSYLDDPYGDDPGGFDWEQEGFQVIDPDNEDFLDDEEEEWDPEKWKEEIEKDEIAPEPVQDTPEVKDSSRQDPPVPRDPRLGPEDPHQFWLTNEDYAQNLLPKLQERAQKGDQDAARLIKEGPRAGRYDKKTLFDTMQDPKFWDKKGSQKYKEQVEKEEGLEPGSLGPMGDDEAQKIRDYYYSDDKKGPVL